MTENDNLIEQLKLTFNETLDAVVGQLPGLLGAIAILVVGWVLARVLRAAAIRALGALNRLLDRVLSGRTRAVVRFSTGVTRLLSGILFWVTLFVFTTLALRVAGFTALAAWLERIVDYLPTILTGGLIILVGYVLSSIVRDVAQAAAQSADLAEAVVIGRMAQAITFITALVVGMSQAGVDTSFITIIFGIATATVLAGFALAFGFGARTLVSNLIAAHYLRDSIELGQTIRVGELEGKVLELTATALIVDTAEGRTSIPAAWCQEQVFSVQLGESKDE